MNAELQRKRRKEMIYNKLHRGFVNTCLIITGVTSIAIAYKVYEYFRYIRPLQSVQTKLVEEDLLMEGKNLEEPADLKLTT